MKTELLFDTIIENFIKLKKQSTLLDDIAKTWIASLEQGNTVIFCGNGGSAAGQVQEKPFRVSRFKSYCGYFGNNGYRQ